MYFISSKKFSFIGPAFSLALIFGIFAPDTSEAVSCSAYVSDAVANNGCQVGLSNNDSVSQVNSDLMFGLDDWHLGTTTSGLSTNKTSDGEDTAGTWAVIETWFDSVASVLFVLKSGNGQNIVPDNYVGYLLGAHSGSYTSPFVNSNGNNNPAEISHFSIYWSNTTTTVGLPPDVIPVPAALPLFGTSLAILGFIGWRRKRKAA